MQTITRIKYIGIDYLFAPPSEQPQLILNVVAEVNNDGEGTDINKAFPLSELSFSDFLGEQDRTVLATQLVSNGIITNDNMGIFAQIFKSIITKKIAADIGASIAGENYVAPPTLKENVQELQTIVADLIAEKLGV